MKATDTINLNVNFGTAPYLWLIEATEVVVLLVVDQLPVVVPTSELVVASLLPEAVLTQPEDEVVHLEATFAVVTFVVVEAEAAVLVDVEGKSHILPRVAIKP